MRGICKNERCEGFNQEVFVHRTAWWRYTPKCKQCGKTLRKTKQAARETLSRTRAAFGFDPKVD